MDQNHEARIRQRAYDLWLSENMPDGRSEAHWHQAEAELADESDSSPDLGAETSPAASGPSAARKDRTQDAHNALLQASDSQNGSARLAKGEKRQRKTPPDLQETH